MKKALLFIFIVLGSLTSFCQTKPLDAIMSAVSPHAPVMQNYDGKGDSYAGKKFNYKTDENIACLKKWMADYPDELLKYKNGVEAILSQTDVSTLNDFDAMMFDAYEAQYRMLKSIANW